MIALDQSLSRPRLLENIGWAIFLGMSWTWCIGMFLPVLMVRDFGFWGWVVFAVPNVLGAAAMGWFVRDPAASDHITQRHSVACAAFSAVTVMFQIMFVGGVVRLLIRDTAGELLLTAAVVTIAAAVTWRRGELFVAAIVFAVSIAAFVVAARAANHVAGAGFPRPMAPMPPGGLPKLLMLAPVCLIGFALCPYLDLTFHRARQATGPSAPGVFALGFCGPFLLMILFTLWYAPLLASLLRAQTLPQELRMAIGVHVSVQCGFTVGVHGRELGWTRTAGGLNVMDRGRVAGLLLGVAASLAPHAAAAAAERSGYVSPAHGEMVYRLFLGFYGLVFPAYVWICVIPTRSGQTELSRRKLRIFMAAVLAAAPTFWKGFIDGQMAWLLAGVGIILLSRLFLWQPRPAPLVGHPT